MRGVIALGFVAVLGSVPFSACGGTRASPSQGPCAKDADCDSDEWCSSGTCLPLQVDGGLGGEAPPPACLGPAQSPSAGRNCGCSFDCDVGELCIDEGAFGNPGGSCVHGCTPEDPCPNGTVCTETQSGATLCEIPCATAADCPKGSICRWSIPGGPFVCADHCQRDDDCPIIGHCDRFTGTCSVGPSGPGTGKVGDPCQTPNDCLSGVCFQPSPKFPDGYCSAYCSVSLQGCPAGASCSLGGDGGEDFGSCFDRCSSEADCRSGYACVKSSTGALVCGPG